jgi:hypothetical protein
VAETSCNGASCDGVAVNWTASEDFLSDFSPGAVVWGAAAGVGWAETPGLALLGASLVVAAIDAAVDAAVGAGAAEFRAKFKSRDETLLLAMFCAAAVVVASDERAWAGAVPSVAESEVGARTAAVRSPGAELPGVELSPLAPVDLGTAGCFAFAGSVTGARLMSRTGVNGAAGTDRDWTIGDWSSAKIVAPVGIGAWNWLSAGGSAGEASVAGVGERGVGETGAEGVANSAGAVEAGSAPVRLVTPSGTAEVAVEPG